MATIHWKSGVNGNFAVAANWNPATVPGAGDEAAIDAAGTYKVTTSASQAVQSLDTAAGATLAIANSVFIAIDATGFGANSGTIAVGNNAQLDFDADVHFVRSLRDRVELELLFMDRRCSRCFCVGDMI